MTFIVIFLLVLANAFYVAAEFSSISVRKTKIKQMAQEKKGLAAKLLPFIEDSSKLDDYISTSQIGITLTSLILGAYGQAQLSDIFTPLFVSWGGLGTVAAESTSSVIVLLLLTTFQMVLAELVPKAIALQYSTEVALYTVIPMKWSLSFFKWSIQFLNGTANSILRAIGVQPSSHKHIHSPEEIDIIISESATGGVIKIDEHTRIHNALQLKIRTAKQLLVPRIHIFAVDIETPIDEFLTLASQCPYNHIPVYVEDMDNITGIIHTKQLVKYFVEKGQVGSLQEVMRPVLLVPESVTADKMLELFSEENCQQAIVIDEFGGTVGLVTLEDVLAEFMGEIGDEFKKEISKIEYLPEEKMRIPGLMRLEEIAFATGINLEAKSDTIGGFVTEKLGHIPEQGERLETDDFEIEVEKLGKRAVASVIMRKK
ncbi:HlyC/CorC family transporter [bacterium]|nr:MAG: HlyC/CorC family transporter [bacterium]